MTRRGRVAVITGAARGIGFACAQQLASDGHRVVIVDSEGADAAAAAIAEHRGSAITCDLGVSAEVEGVAASVIADFGGCDVLVNNVAHGGGARVAFAAHDRALWERTFAVNFRAAVELTTAFLPGMVERGFGRVINVVSNTLFAPPPIGIVAYVSSKGALLGFTRALAREMGGAGITVNAVAPGLVRWRSEGLPHEDSFYDAVAAAQSVPRTLSAEDIAGPVSFLASERSTMMTGQTLCVDGGSVLL